MNVHMSPHHRLSAADVDQLRHGRHRDPFAVLGVHEVGGNRVLRAFYPDAVAVDVVIGDGPDDVLIMTEAEDDGLFEIALGDHQPRVLRIHWPDAVVDTADPYSFGPVLTDLELHLISQGRYFDLALKLGANVRRIDGVDGVLFAVWAPNAHSVSVVGDFNTWDPRRHPMRLRHEGGIWELFVPNLVPGEIYKYAIRATDGSGPVFKADPMARQAEVPPRTGSVVAPPPHFDWSDATWMQQRPHRQDRAAPISIYEVHVGSWLSTPDHDHGTWDAAADRLIPYVAHMGFTHIELMPIAEHPFGGSWGYQPLSMFAPTSRLGDPASFARFVDRCHQAGIGVLLDWVPAHFPTDAHGMVQFDGSALYEHLDPREGFHLDWNTLIYNVGRTEVSGFLISSALWWLRTFHLDGLRVDAVASMLYRDYSRPSDGWIPNRYGGRENLESVAFLKSLNEAVRQHCPGAVMIAEESTAWPGVTAIDGLGFHFKWNMGWMHDTLSYFGRDPIHRGYHLNDITFGLEYGFSEAYVLPISHDEVVHGKGSLLSRMPGDDWQRFANLRLALALMWTHPGKKLLFMGCEFGAEAEWSPDVPFPWPHPFDERRQGVSRLVADLNRLYRRSSPLHRLDTEPHGFSWVICEDSETAVFAFRRSNGNRAEDMLVVLNSTPVPRHDVQVGVAAGGDWAEVFNSDAAIYGGSNVGNAGGVASRDEPAHGEAQSLRLTLPPLGLLVLERR